MTEAYVRLLGPVRFVTADGQVLDLPSPTQRRLLAVLALAEGTTLRTEYLADVLDTTPGALRTALSRVRSRIGEGAIRTDTVGYRLACAVDCSRFTQLLAGERAQVDRLEALDEALSYWHGEVLDEFRHETWAEAEVARLDGLRAIAVEDRAALLIARSRASEAVVALDTHILREPRRDRPRGLLLRALAADGRQADALRAYQDYRSYLAEEAGTEPSDAVRAIERRVAAGWAGVDDVEEGERPAVEPSATGDRDVFDVALHPVLTTGAPLIGRRRELSWLESALVEARTGSLQAVLLSGEAGIGKTTLLAAFARAHHRPGGATVLYGRCTEGAAVPLQPFRSIVTSLVEHAPVTLLQAHTEHSGGDLQRIAPNLPARVSTPPFGASDDATERFLLFEAVADVLGRVAAGGPLVLVLDDLHWAEPTALLLLRHVSRSLVDAPVVLVLSWRDTGDDQSEPLRDALADLDRASARRVPLAGFDDVELSDLVASVTNATAELGAGVLEDLRAETAGNPLYAGQLVRHLVESGRVEVGDHGLRFAEAVGDTDVVPPSLRDVLWSRVQALGEAAAEVLRAAAVLGVEFPERMLVEVAEGGEHEVWSSVDAAVGAGLLADGRGASGSLRFAHALVAHALYAELGVAKRRRLHERAARVLEKEVDGRSQQVVVELARHWERAGDPRAAMRWATAAGDLALEHLAPAEAVHWYRGALDHAVALDRSEAERADLLVRLGVAQHRAGDPVANATLTEGGRIAERCGADDVLVRAVLANEHSLMLVGEPDQDMLSLVEAALAVADQEDTATHAALLAIYALQLVHTPQAERRRQIALEAIEMVERRADPSALPRMISALQFALWGPGALPLRRELADRAAAVAASSADPFLRFWTSRAAYWVAIESADADASASSLDRMRALAAEIGEPNLRWVVAATEAFDLTMRARFEEAEQRSTQSLELGMQIGESGAFPLFAGQLFVIRSFAGRYEELLPLLEDMLAASPEVLPFRLAHAITCTAVGRREEARAVLAAGAAAGFAHIAPDYFWMTTTIGYAVLAVELEEPIAAAELYPILEPYGREVAFNGATSQGHIGAYLGKLASLMGRHDLADEHLHQALEVNLAFGWAYHEATTLVALALSRLRRAGVVDDDMTRWLDRAEAIADDRGLTLVSSQVQRLRAGDPHL